MTIKVIKPPPKPITIPITKIISGHQTGVDLGAIDAAMSLGVPTDGWVPKGRINEEGVIPAYYLVKEMPTAEYPPRTRANVQDSDMTLVIYRGTIGKGTELTTKAADTQEKLLLMYNLNVEEKDNYASMIKECVADLKGVVNIAGSRESGSPGIQNTTYEIVRRIILAQRGGK